MLLHTDNLSFSYRDIPVFSNITFSIQEHEFVALIGPNGSGKTTALNLIMGFLQPTQGTIHTDKPLTIGYVPQNPSFDKEFPLSVLDVVQMGCASHYKTFGGITMAGKQAALEALETIGLRDKANTPYGELSGGQAQRVLIARSLASKPNLLILDEPTSNIDTASEQAIIELIQKLKTSMTILMVTHDFHTITHCVDRVLLFQKGVVSLAPKDLCNHYTIGVYHNPGEHT